LHRNLGSRLPAPTPTPRRRIRRKEPAKPSVSSDTEDINSDGSFSEFEFILGTGITSQIETPDDQTEGASNDTAVTSQVEPGQESEPESEMSDDLSEATIEDEGNQSD
jgi:hypothetical protein